MILCKNYIFYDGYMLAAEPFVWLGAIHYWKWLGVIHYCWKLEYSCVCVKIHGKKRIRTEKYFSDGVPSENNTQKYNDGKISFFYEFAVRNSFSVGT